MIKGWDLTIYELFGYLLPGMVAFAAIWIGVSSYYHAWLYFPTLLRMGWVGRALVLLVPSYFLGHVTHAVANRIGAKRLEKCAAATVMKCVPVEAIRSICKAMEIRDVDKWKTSEILIEPIPFLGLCSEIVEQNGKSAEREVFAYREGFYRGATVSLILLVMALVVLAIIGTIAPITRGNAIAGAVVGLFVTALFVDRYHRFARYRMGACVNGAIVITASAKKPAGSKRKKVPETT